MPNAADSGRPNPANYTDLGNGAVRDNVTCLVWQKQESVPAPSTFSPAPAMPGTLNDAVAYCADLATSGYGGFNDWRVPTRIEMASIVDTSRTGSALDPAFVKEASGYDRTFSLWYETIAGIKLDAGNDSFGWVYNMSSGLTSNAYAAYDSTAKVRCVSGNGDGESLMQQAVEPPNHYTVAAGEVTDNYTGLVWQQVYSGSTMAWSAAAGYCAALGLNGHSWRVPSLNELATLVNEAKVSPAVDATAFPSVASCGATTWFWAAEAYAGGTTYDWGINFCDGYTGYNAGMMTAAKTDWNYFTDGYVRCVR
jgi:hypothetical protein